MQRWMPGGHPANDVIEYSHTLRFTRAVRVLAAVYLPADAEHERVGAAGSPQSRGGKSTVLFLD